MSLGGFHGHLRSSEDLEAHRLEALGDRGLGFERSRTPGPAVFGVIFGFEN